MPLKLNNIGMEIINNREQLCVCNKNIELRNKSRWGDFLCFMPLH